MRTCTLATAVSIAGLSGGVIATILESANVDTAVFIVAAVTALIAAMVLCSNHVVQSINSEVRKTNRPADKAFKLGYEMGHNSAWREAREEARLTEPRKIGLAAMDGEAVGN